MNNNLQFLVENYQTPPDAIELIEKSQILLLAGISGAGKDTTKKHLIKNYANYRDIVSHTTRMPRDNNGKPEQDGIHYNFISKDCAEEMLKNREFIEAKFVHDNIYGTSIEQISRANQEERISITDIDIQGIAEYKKISSKVIAIFILPPDYITWRSRLANRYSSQDMFEADFIKRLPEAISSLKQALSVPYFHFILNDDFRNTARIIDQIVHQPVEFNYKDIEVRILAEKLLADIEEKYNQLVSA